MADLFAFNPRTFTLLIEFSQNSELINLLKLPILPNPAKNWKFFNCIKIKNYI